MLNGCSETSGYRFSFLQCLGLYRLLQQSPATTARPEKYCIAKYKPQLGEAVNCGRPLVLFGYDQGGGKRRRAFICAQDKWRIELLYTVRFETFLVLIFLFGPFSQFSSGASPVTAGSRVAPALL